MRDLTNLAGNVRTSHSMANRVALTVVFTLSFLSYMAPELTASVQLVPLVLLGVLVFFKVFWSAGIVDALWSLFELDGLLYVLFISLLAIAPSLASGSERSFELALVISGCLILARLYMAVVPVREVFEAFFWSGILSVSIYIPLSFADLMQSATTLERFWNFSFHPNLLAFVLAGYFCAMVWKFLTGDWRMKVLTGLVGPVCLIIIFFASSRGSIVGIIAGGSLIAATAILGAKRETQRKVLRFGLLGVAALLGLLLLIRNRPWAQDASSFVDQVLQLSQDYRGIDSGFSGRLNKWNATLQVFSDGTWLLGHGIRTSDSMEDQLIDNSFLVILYEIGMLPLILITLRFLSISSKFVSGYFRVKEEQERYLCLSCSLLMVVLLVNSVVARLLFGVGNPYSLLALFLFAAPASRIVPRLSNRINN